ncbi:hypothetical protein ACL02S_10420 [Nocardia sp. 004]|uniref:hypothetical protein n=1 Tax=Nocardia sp. 004 TaxID=3385978 RepID=UPI0039A215E9
MAVAKHRKPAHPVFRRAATLAVASTIPLSVVGAATASAHPLIPDNAIQLPFEPMPAIAPAAPVAPVAAPFDPLAPLAPLAPFLPPGILPAPPPAPETPPVSAGRNDLSTNRPMPDPNELAPVIPEDLHLPNLSAMAPPVAPIEAPPGTLRIGSLVVGRPDFLTPEQGKVINDAIAGPEASIAQVLDSAGFEPSRSDRIAADVVGASAIGASVGSMVAAPVASIGLVIGAISGAIAGLPMFPTGTVVTTIFGAAVGYGFVASPAIAIGAAVGAGVGVVQGLLAPPTIPAE